MKISKSAPLIATHKMLRYNEENIFSITGIIPFSLLDQSVLTEQDFYTALGEVLELGAFDSGVKKESSEYLINGQFCAPNNKPIEAGYVKAEVGGLNKKILVSGDRFWQANGLPSKPVLFTTKPLLSTYAYGGEGYDLNSQGKGFIPDDDGIYWLPNIEYTNHLLTSRRAQSKPANFSQTSLLDLPRKKFVGTVKEGDDPYSLPQNINWHYFNDAPQDQWFNEPLTGGENYCFYNMHPEHAVINGQLPPMRLRAFIKRALKDEPSVIEEIPMTLDTLWFSPHQELGALVFHGSTLVGDRFGKEIAHLLLAFEDKDDNSRDLAWYQQALLNRENDDLAIKFMLYCRDIIPASVELDMDADDDDPDAMQDFMGDNIDAYMEQVQTEVEQEVSKQTQLSHDKLVDSKVTEQLSNAIKPLDDEIKRLTTKDAEKASALTQEEKTKLNKLIADKKGLDDKLNEIKDAIALQALMAKDLNAAMAANKTDDPELQKLLDFVASITPMRKDKPDQIDLAAVDMKKLSQLGDKIDEYMAVKLTAMVPEVEQQFAEAKAQLAKAADMLKPVKAEGTEKVTEAEQKIIDAQAALIKAEADTLAMLSGEELPSPIFRPPTGSTLDEMQLELDKNIAQAREQINQAQQVIEQEKMIIKQTLAALPEASTQAQQLQERLSELNNTMDIEGTNAKFQEAQEGLAQQKTELDEGAPELKATYAMGAHFMDKGLSPHEKPIEAIQADFNQKRASGDELSHGDWACLRFDNEQWLGLGLSHCYFEQTRFSDCEFDSVDFSHCILARAEFNNCRFKDCNFDGANIGASKIQNCQFTHCEFKESILSNALIDNSQFENCHLHDNQSLELKLKHVTFKESEIFDLNLIEGAFPECGFIECYLKACVFIELKAPKLIVHKSKLERIVWTDVALADADFSGCELLIQAFFGQSDLSGANFSNCRGETVNFSGVNLANSNFKGANISQAHFAEANFKEADFSRAVLRQGNFSDANLEAANLQYADLMEANFTNARLVSANFKFCHLFSAHFLESTFGDTHFMGADLSQTLIEDWRP